jgi:predicted nucleic acid-binding protein
MRHATSTITSTGNPSVNSVFADTPVYIALLNHRDVDHDKAVRFRAGYPGKYFTTDFVIVELGNWLSAIRERPIFLQLADALRQDSATTIIPASTEWISRGLEFFRKRLDQEWSLTDCMSFLAMEDLQITDALTADHHFEQAGFAALLK